MIEIDWQPVQPEDTPDGKYTRMETAEPGHFGTSFRMYKYLPKDTGAVIISRNDGRGRKPFRLSLPHQLYEDQVEELHENGAHIIEVYPVLNEIPWIEVSRLVR